MTLHPSRLAASLCVAVASGDLAQIALLTWRPKHWGTLAGAALYLALAAAIARGHRAALFVVAGMPLVPLAVLAAWAAGAPLPFRPDPGMLAVLGLQLAAAAAAVRSARPAPP